MTNEKETVWLKQLQQDLIDNRDNETTQANPIYYGIYDYKEQVVPEGHEDHIRLYDTNTCETMTIEEYLNNLDDDEKQAYLDDEYSGLRTDDGKIIIDSPSEFIWQVQEHTDDTIIPLYIADIGYIVPDCMFLTRKDAQAHLDANRHHYTSDAHTYAMTAWRSPRVEHLLKLLVQIDFDKSKLMLKEGE